MDDTFIPAFMLKINVSNVGTFNHFDQLEKKYSLEFVGRGYVDT